MGEFHILPANPSNLRQPLCKLPKLDTLTFIKKKQIKIRENKQLRYFFSILLKIYFAREVSFVYIMSSEFGIESSLTTSLTSLNLEMEIR